MTAEEEARLLAAGWVKGPPCARCGVERGWSTSAADLCEICGGKFCAGCCEANEAAKEPPP